MVRDRIHTALYLEHRKHATSCMLHWAKMQEVSDWAEKVSKIVAEIAAVVLRKLPLKITIQITIQTTIQNTTELTKLTHEVDKVALPSVLVQFLSRSGHKDSPAPLPFLLKQPPVLWLKQRLQQCGQT